MILSSSQQTFSVYRAFVVNILGFADHVIFLWQLLNSAIVARKQHRQYVMNICLWKHVYDQKNRTPNKQNTFEFHAIFMCYEIFLFFFFQLFKNVKIFLTHSLPSGDICHYETTQFLWIPCLVGIDNGCLLFFFVVVDLLVSNIPTAFPMFQILG